MNFIKKNYRLILCILITILFLLFGFNFKYSFKRLPEVLFDLWNSILCFIDFILDLDMEVNPTILNPNDIVDDKIDIKENFIDGKYIVSILSFLPIP